MGCLAYYLSISSTIELWKSNNEIKQQLERAQYAPEQISALQAQLAEYNKLLMAYGGSIQREEYLLSQLSGSCKKNAVQLASLTPPQLTIDNGYKIETRIVKLKGSFINLLWVIYHMEKIGPAGRLSSVKFVIEEDRKNAANYLFAYLYIQNLSEIEQ
jgi:hypothetical protein